MKGKRSARKVTSAAMLTRKVSVYSGKGDPGVQLDRPAAELLLIQAASTAAVHNPLHHEPVHGGNGYHGEDNQPYARAEGHAGDPGRDDQLQEGSEDIKRRGCRVAAAGESPFKRVGQLVGNVLHVRTCL